jgi:hypothetical protein
MGDNESSHHRGKRTLSERKHMTKTKAVTAPAPKKTELKLPKKTAGGIKPRIAANHNQTLLRS